MAVWRLIAHHHDAESQIRAFAELGCIAIGWSGIGDLQTIRPRSAAEITPLVKDAYPDLENAHLGGPSLWRFYAELRAGDLVIISDGNHRRAVMKVNGDYVYVPRDVAENTGGYRHRRAAETIERNADDLWSECGSMLEPGENIRWTLARCASPA